MSEINDDDIQGGYVMGGSVADLRKIAKSKGHKITYKNKKGHVKYYTKSELRELLGISHNKRSKKKVENHTQEHISAGKLYNKIMSRKPAISVPMSEISAGALHKKHKDVHNYLAKVMEIAEKKLMEPHIIKFYSE